MKLGTEESLEAFRSRLIAWLDENLPTEEEIGGINRGSSAHLPPWARVFQRKLFDNGWLVPGWPPELGGQNATAQEQMVFFEVMAKRQVPRALNPQGLSIVAASLIDFGTEEQKERFAIPTMKAEITWCIGMSEPGAGSDLAGLSTKAEIDGDRFIVNGQKVWTSGAHDADFCLCYVRTDPTAPKHKGISVVIIDMKSPGITCRPLPELTDPHHIDFNEVFFDNVEVPLENLVGPLNGGWALSQGSLAHERAMLWVMNVATMERALEGLLRLAKHDDGRGGVYGDDPRFADEVGKLAIDVQAVRCLGYRGFAKVTKGEVAREHMILKLFSSESERHAARVGAEIQGSGGLDTDGHGPRRIRGVDVKPQLDYRVIDPTMIGGFDTGSWVVQYLRNFAGTIAGGTSEIQRNIISERVLGMPRV